MKLLSKLVFVLGFGLALGLTSAEYTPVKRHSVSLIDQLQNVTFISAYTEEPQKVSLMTKINAGLRSQADAWFGTR